MTRYLSFSLVKGSITEYSNPMVRKLSQVPPLPPGITADDVRQVQLLKCRHPQDHLEPLVLVLGEGQQLRTRIDHTLVEFSGRFRSLDCRGKILGHVHV